MGIDVGALSVPMLVGAGLVLALLALAMVARLRWSFVAVGAMLFLGSLGVAETWKGQEIRLWLYPLQTNRSFFFVVLGTLLLVPMVVHGLGATKRGLGVQGLILLAIGLYAGLLRMVHESPGSGLMTIAYVLLTVLPLLCVMAALLSEPEGALDALRMILVVNIIWVGVVAVEPLLHPGRLMVEQGARFIGVAPNPQHAALSIAAMGAVAWWAVLNDPARRFRMLWLALLGADSVLLLWTGSRTGAAVFVIGVTVAVYGRIGRTILYLPIAAAALYGALYVASLLHLDLVPAAERLVSMEETRAGAWARMLQDGLNHPWIGVGVEETKSENAYLKALATYGIGMLSLTLVMVLVSARLMWRLFRLRRWLEPDRRALVDMIIAFNAMYFAASLFEGVSDARVSSYLVLMLIFSAMVTNLLKREAELAALADHGDFEELSAWDDSYGYEVNEDGGDVDHGERT